MFIKIRRQLRLPPLVNSDAISLVIPGKNAGSTLGECLASAMSLLDNGEIDEIVFVDDGSTDDTRSIVARYPVRYLSTDGVGPGPARNVGWKATSSELVWFIDADCVANPDTVSMLLAAMDTPEIGGVGGSYFNATPESYLAWLIHEEIVARHSVASERITYLGSYNVLYRKEVLRESGGFAEDDFNAPGSPGAEDADLSYRIVDAGYKLRLEPRSLVGHHHPTKLKSYARAQAGHGYWGARLYARHPRKVRNSYSGPFDHLQPPVAMICLASLPGLLIPNLHPWVPLPWAFLSLLTLPMTARLLLRTRSLKGLGYPLFSVWRAFPRGIGMLAGVASLGLDRLRAAGSAGSS